jgi:hypothetical protein
MLPKPRTDMAPNTLEFEILPLVKPTGFREYDARWWFNGIGHDKGAGAEPHRRPGPRPRHGDPLPRAGREADGRHRP